MTDTISKKRLLHLGSWKFMQPFKEDLRWTWKQLKKWTTEQWKAEIAKIILLNEESQKIFPEVKIAGGRNLRQIL